MEALMEQTDREVCVSAYVCECCAIQGRLWGAAAAKKGVMGAIENSARTLLLGRVPLHFPN